ncbi:hypothetical protein K490DRAFT_54771 [Saccharata proteae CBS 121410]|uniref:Phosphoribosylaminoimidazole-succinocarboxamide synthase n=1 Tax=Saccharata proteae CBS 121410 TaxID=1314787 RepID=A0A9P4I099_9PEZI|nr:hypothetical protein K490DRAFT_54771 [Saccharata proteae CBS 121410]
MTSHEPLLALKSTNVSRPQIQHTSSQQSIAASEDYYSFSEHTSSESDDRSQVTVVRYRTPPSQFHTPEQSREQIAQVAPLSTVAEARHSQEHSARQSQDQQASAPRSVDFDERTIRRKPVSAAFRSSQLPPQPGMDSESISTTPGVDDTPYIRFAIDQLTRDEEVRGSRRYAAGPSRNDDYPVDRIIPDEGLGYINQGKASPPHLPSRSPLREPPVSPVQRDLFVPYNPPSESLVYPPLNFLPAIIRPVSLAIFTVLCLLMLAGLIVCAVWSMNNNGLLHYSSLGDGTYFLFEYLPTMLGMILLLWLQQIAIAVQRISPFMALASDSARSRSEGVFLDLYPTQFLLPKVQYFGAGEPLVGIFSIISWLFIWTVPLLACSFNVRYYGTLTSGEWRWVAVQGVIWTVIAIYILLVVAIIFLVVDLRRGTGTGLKWDARSLADIIALLERSNIMKDYANSESFASNSKFRDRLATRTDRLGYWHTSRRPNDIFYGLGEPGGATRRYAVEQGRIREKTPEPSFGSESVDLESGYTGGEIRMDVRDEHFRHRYLPWFMKDTFVVAWIVIAAVLLLAFLIVSFVDNAVIDGFLPQVSAGANSAGFSASNFLYSFIPALIATILFLLIQTLDFTVRRLQPYAELSTPGGSPASHSLLLDYPARLPISVTVAAAANSHWRVALLSLATLIGATLPILAGGCFFTQYYANSPNSIRVAAHPEAYYALCVFLALYAFAIPLLFPGRKAMALPHESASLTHIISWLYQSPIVADRAFARLNTKAELVTRLLGDPTIYDEPVWARSLRNLVTPSRRNLRDARNQERLRDEEAVAGPSRRRPMSGAEKRLSLTAPSEVRYGFGVFYGRDGKEHLGIDRVQRGEGRMMHFD